MCKHCTKAQIAVDKEEADRKREAKKAENLQKDLAIAIAKEAAAKKKIEAAAKLAKQYIFNCRCQIIF